MKRQRNPGLSRKSSGSSWIALRSTRATLLIDFAPVGIGGLGEIDSRRNERNVLQCAEQRMALARTNLFTPPIFRELAQLAVFGHERLHVCIASVARMKRQRNPGYFAGGSAGPDCAEFIPGHAGRRDPGAQSGLRWFQNNGENAMSSLAGKQGPRYRHTADSAEPYETI